jgi:hypothetical protein
VRTGPSAEGWGARQRALLRTADELHERREISDQLWAQLREYYSDPELIELRPSVVASGWVAGVLPVRMLAQRLVDAIAPRDLDEALEIARREHAPLTTRQPQ